MQSADEFTPSTTEPVFGSGLISQTKNQTSTNDNEKVIPPSETIVNGQNDATVNKLTSSENITNGTNETNDENSGATDSSAVHVNGEQEKPMVEINDEVQPAENSVSATEQPIVPPTESEPVSSAPVDTVNEVSSTAVDIAPPAPVVEEPTTTTTEVVNDNVPEVPVATESEPTEVKSKSPRGKAKAPVALTTPTRQSTRGRKPASSSNADENLSTDETSSSSSSQRTKRQAATLAKDAIAASSQANSTDDVQEQDVVPTDVGGGDNDNPTEGQTKASPSPGKKRGAPKSTPTAPKKARGPNSLTPTNDVNTEATANEGELVQTPPPKKARTSATKKTPEPPSEEYARKLRPRK